MDIQDLRILARVAALQNLSAVGLELGLTPGTISKRIQSVEDDLKVRLFDRTTRSIRMTEEGRLFLARVERILAELDLGRAEVEGSTASPRGRLKVAAPVDLGRRSIAPLVCEFMSAYPEIDIHVDLTDRLVNLQEEGYDIAIRTGVLSDSALIAKRLAPDPQVIVASPRYLASAGTPRAPADLDSHSCLVLCDQWSWGFERNGEETAVRIGGRLRSNSVDVLRHAALDGQGLLRVSAMRVEDDIAAGRLVRLLADYDVSGKSAVWALYPSAKHVLPRLRVLLDFLADWFRPDAGGPGLRRIAAAAGQRLAG